MGRIEASFAKTYFILRLQLRNYERASGSTKVYAPK